MCNNWTMEHSIQGGKAKACFGNQSDRWKRSKAKTSPANALYDKSWPNSKPQQTCTSSSEGKLSWFLPWVRGHAKTGETNFLTWTSSSVGGPDVSPGGVFGRGYGRPVLWRARVVPYITKLSFVYLVKISIIKVWQILLLMFWVYVFMTIWKSMSDGKSKETVWTGIGNMPT